MTINVHILILIRYFYIVYQKFIDTSKYQFLQINLFLYIMNK